MTGLLCLAVTTTAMDNTIVNLALPAMSAPPLAAGLDDLQWVVASYVIVLACLVLVAGAAGDRWGRRRALLAGTAAFAAGSVGAGLATSVPVLVTGRVVMGVGAALMVANSLALLVALVPPGPRRHRAVAVWSAAAGLGIALGPVVGGVLLDYLPWGALFLVNVPLCALVGLVALPGGRPPPSEPPRGGPDVAGGLVSTLALAALSFAIIGAPVQGWTAPATVVALLVAASLAALLVLVERRATHPILKPGLIARPAVAGAVLTSSVAFFAVFGMLFPLGQYLQQVRAASPITTGLLLLPLVVVLAAASLVSVPAAARYGNRAVVLAGLLVIVAGLASVIATVSTEATVPVVAAAAVTGLGMGLILAPTTEIILAAVPAGEVGAGNGMNQAARQLGVALGVTVLGSVLSTSYRRHASDRSLSDPALLDRLATGPQRAALAEAYQSGLGPALLRLGESGPAAAAALAQARAAFVQAMADVALVASGVALAAAALWMFLTRESWRDRVDRRTPTGDPYLL